MELQDPKIENPTNVSNITHSTVDNEVEESRSSDMSHEVIIKTSEKPEKPKVVKCNDRDLSISWDVSSYDCEVVDFFEIQWKKKDEKRWSGRKNTDNNCNTIKLPITDLEKNTAYQFKVRWTTQEGVESQFSDISDDVLIEMSQKPGKPKGVTGNGTDLLISWDVPSIDLQAVDFFELHWKKKEEKRWSGRKTIDDNRTTMKIPITELEKNIAYQFKVRWTTQEGVESQFSDISDDIIIEMSQKYGKPKGVTINDTDLLISWDVTSSDLQAIDFFELHWKKKEEKSWSGRKNISGNSTTMKIPITELEKNIAYQFKVRWTTQEGVESQFSDISDDIIIEMSQKPGKPKGITSNDADLLISWDVTSSNLQVVDFFELHWKKKNEKRWSGRKNTDDNCTTMKIPITELEKNIAYQFKVRWTTQEGVESQFSDISDDIIIEMSQKPGKPKGVTSKGIDLLISWDLPSSDLQVVDFFEIQWKKKDEKRWLGRRNTDDNSTSISIPITQFEKNTVYEFKVRWITKDGLESMFSEISEDIIIVMTKMPDKPNVVRRNDTDLLICWHVSSSDLQGIDYFEIQWKTKEEKRWSGLKCTDDNSTSIAIPITEFERNNTYQFKVKWITRNCEESQFSEISDDILIAAPMSTRSPQQPGKVSSSQTTANSAYLLWEKPEGPDEVSYYEVKYRSCGEVRWLRINTDQPVEKLHLKDLKGSTNYEFEVRAIFSDGNDGPYSEVSDMVTTQESLAQMLKIRATKVGYSNPQIYKIPLTFSGQTTNKNVMTRKARFGERVQLHSTKTIILVGATGAGKSTLIDAMINYIVGVSWEDDYRFTMIDMTEDEKSVANKQVFRQTNWITCYEVNYQSGSRLNYNLNIIDTPGFGDIRGIDQDKKILNQIHEFFKAPGDQGIDSIDAVCLVIQAPLVRLRPTQQYILNAILSLFGKDVTDNIFVLITFADGTEPPVIAALRNENVPFQQTFKFNNSALYKDSSDCFATMFWKLGISSFDNLFCQLSKTRTKSLWLTTEVLSQSKQIEDLSPQIRDVLRKMKTMKKEIEKEKQICVKENLKSYFRSLRQQVFSMMNSVKKSLDKLAEYALKPNGFNEVNNVHLLIESEKLEARYGWEHRVQTLEEIKTGAVLVQKIRDASVQNFSTDEDLSKFLESV